MPRASTPFVSSVTLSRRRLLLKYSRIRYELKDDHQWIRVVDVLPDGHRYLHFEDSVQGVLDLGDPASPVLEYVGLMADAVLRLAPSPKRAILGGLGSGTLLHSLSAKWPPSTKVLNVEANPRVCDLARKWFMLDEKHRVVRMDLRASLETKARESVDLVVIDCYTATTVPPHLTTLEFLYLLHQTLRPGGSAVFNIWSPNCNKLCGDQLLTLLEVFGEAGLVKCIGDANLVVSVKKEPAPEWPEYLRFKVRTYPVKRLALNRPEAWPNYMKDCIVLEDGCFDRVLGGIEYSF